MIRFANCILGMIAYFFAFSYRLLNAPFRNQFLDIKQKVHSFAKEDGVLPPLLLLQLIQIEDRRFYAHFGVDFYAMVRAFRSTITRRLEGGSTIVQQLIRNLNNERQLTINRKLREICFSVLVNKEFSKTELLQAYVNSYAFGRSLGVNSLCQNEKYDLTQLSASGCAEIIARFKYPNINAGNYSRYLKRVRIIERRGEKWLQGGPWRDEHSHFGIAHVSHDRVQSYCL